MFSDLFPLDVYRDLRTCICVLTAASLLRCTTLPHPIQVEIDGLAWGEAHKLVPVAFGVKKLVLSCVVDDDKVSFKFQFCFPSYATYNSHTSTHSCGTPPRFFCNVRYGLFEVETPVDHPHSIHQVFFGSSAAYSLWQIFGTR